LLFINPLDATAQTVGRVSNGVTTAYINAFTEVTGSAMTKDYYLNGERVIMRNNASGVWLDYDLHGAHLGSTVLITHQDGSTVEGFMGLPLSNFPDGNMMAGANGVFLGFGIGGELDLSVGLSYAFEALRVDTHGRQWLPDVGNYHLLSETGEVLHQAYWELGFLMFGDSWLTANNNW